MTENLSLTEKERKLLSLVPESGEPVTTNDIIAGAYQKAKPVAARSIIHARMTTIIKKLNAAQSQIKIVKAGGAGPRPVTYRREAR